MKKLSVFITTAFFVLLIGCSGSDTYRGAWKATDSSGNKLEIVFDAKSFTVSDTAGKAEKYDYTQNSVRIENGVKTYGIKLGDGRAYQINFPVVKDESLAIMKDQNGHPVYTISRTEYKRYEDVFKLK